MPGSEVLNLDGRCLLPGFIDAHGHFANALQVVAWANVQRPPGGPVSDIASLLQLLRAHAASTVLAAGQWLIGYGYDPDGLADGRRWTKAISMRRCRTSRCW